MCGIVGYVGDKECTSILIEGLRKLEYRGYDSAGIAVLDPAKEGMQITRVVRCRGKLSNLENMLRAEKPNGRVGIGQDNRRGWSVAFQGNYDYLVHTLQYAFTQVSYNTDCCGFAAQYRRFNFGTRQENQWRVAFAVANVGTFGTLKRQERIF